MNVSRHIVLFVLASGGLTACGGRAVDGDPGNDPDETSDEAKKPSAGEDSAESESDSSESSSLLQLGECKGGHDPDSGKLCPWMDADGTLCFASKEGACDCLCPQNRNSVCLSGFYNGTDGRTLVSCD